MARVIVRVMGRTTLKGVARVTTRAITILIIAVI
jgi:hypothetical protein